ncbi:hypothetical protein [Thermorudis peleae]|uniref:hypothetical protein n=1 Tax=Thermorudis peleae TaxID=1382356 RepID=UPI000571DC82|nr:hypothetical protein [Thermorudis peleae]
MVGRTGASRTAGQQPEGQDPLLVALSALHNALSDCIASLRAGDLEQLAQATQAINAACRALEQVATYPMGEREQALLAAIRARLQQARMLVQTLLTTNAQALALCQAQLTAQASYGVLRPRYGVDRSA